MGVSSFFLSFFFPLFFSFFLLLSFFLSTSVFSSYLFCRFTNHVHSASLNHPPFAGARPGLPGTENYEPPSVPQTAPRMTFRTRAESPAPNLVTAPAEPQTPAPGTSASGDGRRRAGGSYTQTPGMPGYAGSYQNMTGTGMPSSASTTVQTPLATPAATPSLSAAGATMFNMGGAAHNPGNGPHGTHGTYSFTGLGSPFAHNGAGMVSNGPSPIASSFAQGNNASMPPNANMFNMAPGPPGGQNMMGSQEAWAISRFQAAQQAAFNHTPGNNGNGALGIHPNMPFYQGAHTMSPQDMANYFSNGMPTSMPMATSMSMPGMSTTAGHVESQPSGRRPSAPVYSNAEIIESVIRKHSPLNKTTGDATTAAPQESLGPISGGSKRKRGLGPVEVEFNPPKKAMLAPSPDMTGDEVQDIAASRPYGLSSAINVYKTRRKKTASASTDSPQAAASVTDEESSASPSISGLSPSVAPVSTPRPRLAEVWHEGTHGDCTVSVSHRHDGDALCFKALGDFEKAAEAYCKGKTSVVTVPTPVLPSQITDKVFDLVSHPADTDANMEATEVTEDVQVPSQEEPEAQPAPVAAQDSVLTQVQSQPQEVQAEQQTQVDAPAPATVSVSAVTSVDTEALTAPATGMDTSIEDLIRTHIAASLQEQDNSIVKTAMPVTTMDPTLSTAAFSAPVLAPIHHNVVPSKAPAFDHSYDAGFFAEAPMDLASFGFDNISITEAYFNNNLGGTTNDDLFDMLDDSQF